MVSSCGLAARNYGGYIFYKKIYPLYLNLDILDERRGTQNGSYNWFA